MVRDSFAIFILAHGRPDNIHTINTLAKHGYTGKWYLILDDEDNTVGRYKELFGEEHCYVFSKSEAAKRFDVMDPWAGRNTITFARNMCNDIARELGLRYFAEFEDDYLELRHRFEDGDSLKAVPVIDLDSCCEAMLEFVDTVSAVNPNFRTIAWAQAGEMIGGKEGYVWKKRFKRKAMNTFFFKVPDDPKDDVKFIGRMNDDVNSYTSDGNRGGIWLQISAINLNQVVTQKASGGNATAYRASGGTYQKSLYSVMLCPHSTRIGVLGPSDPRIHHTIRWETCVPVIINEKYRKKR